LVTRPHQRLVVDRQKPISIDHTTPKEAMSSYNALKIRKQGSLCYNADGICLGMDWQLRRRVMNVTDIIFILLLFGGLALGFFQGTIRLVIAVVAFYVAIILASLYFPTVGLWLQQRFDSSLYVGQIIAFTLVLLISFGVLTAAGLYTFRYAAFPESLAFIDRTLGVFLGLIMGALFLGILANILIKLFYPSIGDLNDLPLMVGIQKSVRGSGMVKFFSSYILQLILSIVYPFLPDSAIRIIFQTQ
jgi:uncharacterized membrane protein required for colicin V production